MAWQVQVTVNVLCLVILHRKRIVCWMVHEVEGSWAMPVIVVYQAWTVQEKLVAVLHLGSETIDDRSLVVLDYSMKVFAVGDPSG